MNIEAGDHFHVSEVVEVLNRNGQVKMRFLPGFTYPVTTHSRETVQTLADEGRPIVKGTAPGPHGARISGAMKGRVTIAGPGGKP